MFPELKQAIKPMGAEEVSSEDQVSLPPAVEECYKAKWASRWPLRQGETVGLTGSGSPQSEAHGWASRGPSIPSIVQKIIFICVHVFQGEGKLLIKYSRGVTNPAKLRSSKVQTVLHNGKWRAVGRSGPELRPPHFYPGVSFLQTVHHVARLCQWHGPQMLHFCSPERWPDSFTALLDFVFRRPQFFVMVKYFWRDLDPFL